MLHLYSELEMMLVLNHPALGGARELVPLIQSGQSALSVAEKILNEDFCRKRSRLQACLADFDPRVEVRCCQEQGVQLITLQDSCYPQNLKQIVDPPLVLYVLGNIEELDEAAVAIVGARQASFYGETQTKKIVADLAQRGVTIVSGLAKGVDQYAHEAVVRIPGARTLAVLGSGFNHFYPKENQKLRDRIIECGAVMTEYPLDTKPLPRNFPRRNRIISGLSLAVCVMEAHVKSGSLITARLGLEQGREIFAMPGPIDSITSGGCHQLIQEGAYLLQSAVDVVRHLELPLARIVGEHRITTVETEDARNVGVSESGSEPVEAVDVEEFSEAFGKGALHYDELLEKSSSRPQELLASLTQWEMDESLVKRADGRFEPPKK